MDPFKKAVAQSQDWSDAQQAWQDIDRAAAARRELEDEEHTEDAWLRDQLNQPQADSNKGKRSRLNGRH